MSEAIYQAMAEASPADTPIGHGFTYSGHPVSAAVGLEVLRLYTEGGILANGQQNFSHRRANARFVDRCKCLPVADGACCVAKAGSGFFCLRVLVQGASSQDVVLAVGVVD